MYRDFKSSVHLNSQYQSLLGIYPIWLGWLSALQGFECKPRVLDDYFIIYVTAGSGIFKCKGKDFTLEKNDVYFLFPGVVHYYSTDPSNLLELWWAGFNGSNAGIMLESIGISPEQPIIKSISDTSVFATLREIVDSAGDLLISDLLKTSGNLYKLFGQLMENCCDSVLNEKNQSLHYTQPVMRAVCFIAANYPYEISIQDVANHASLSRSHFATIFKNEVGSSPSEYLASVRMQHAKRYLADSRLSIMEIAHSVGFQDSLYFSKFFHKLENCSPSQYRSKLIPLVGNN